jgi:TetR/AcrR family transcriptional repressor of bet genes
MAEPTMMQISTRAGLASGGIISHYFASKEELLEETYRELTDVFVSEVACRVRTSCTPIDKVEGIVAAVFAPSQTSPEAVSAWLWFWSRASINSGYADIERATYNHVRDELEVALLGLVAKRSAKDVAEGMLALMYGLWLRFAMDPKGVDSSRATRITLDSVWAQLGINGTEATRRTVRSAKRAASVGANGKGAAKKAAG